MFLGHYGLALATKGTEAGRRPSLGTLVFAAQFLDLLWPVLLLAGIERVRIEPGLMQASALDFEHYPWSHSLLMTVVWATIAAVVYYVVKRRSRAAWLVGGLVLSHWLLDLPFHRPDLPLYPGSDAFYGGALWNSIAATLALEALLFATGVVVYTRATRARDRIGSWGLWAGVALLVVFYLGSFAGTPPDATTLAIGGLTLWLLVPWAAWIDRHREPRTLPGGSAIS